MNQADRALAVHVVAAVVILVAVVLVAVAFVLSQPVDVSVACAAAEWRELPNNLSWGGGVRMLPERGGCQLTLRAPVFVLLRGSDRVSSGGSWLSEVNAGGDALRAGALGGNGSLSPLFVS